MERIVSLFDLKGGFLGQRAVMFPQWRGDDLPLTCVAVIDGVARDFRLLGHDRRSKLLVYVEYKP